MNLDRELYARAEALFERRLREIGRRSVDFGQSRISVGAAFASGRVRYRFSEALIGEGFHRREEKQPEGDWFRWTGPGKQATLWFPASIRRAHRVRLRLVDAASADHFRQLSLSFDGSEVNLMQERETGDRIGIFSGQVSATSSAEPVAVSVRTLEPMVYPYSEEDSRRVGVAIHWIEFDV